MNERQTYPNGTTALVDIESEGPEWLDWCAALYESRAADGEAIELGLNYPDRVTRHLYSATAHTLAEDLEYDLYERAEQSAAVWI